MKKVKRPTSVRLTGRRFKINWIDNDEFHEHFMGRYIESKAEIQISVNCGPDAVKATVIHEIVHDLDRQAGTGLDERGVNAIAILLFAVLRDNPELVNWIMSEE